jgi:hypothetical protein
MGAARTRRAIAGGWCLWGAHTPIQYPCARPALPIGHDRRVHASPAERRGTVRRRPEFWSALAHFLAFFADPVVARRLDVRAKDRQILVPRQQLRIFRRRRPRPPRPTRGEKLALAVLAAVLARPLRTDTRAKTRILTPHGVTGPCAALQRSAGEVSARYGISRSRCCGTRSACCSGGRPGRRA